MIKKIFLVAGMASFLLLILFPFKGAAGPAAFLEQGIGPRAMGMGGAFTAVADDATAGYWNPAGLGHIEHIQATAMLQRLASQEWPGMEDIRPGYNFFNVAVPFNMTGLLDSGAFSVSLVTMDIDNIPLTGLEPSGAISRDTFSNSERAVIISGGYPFFRQNILIGGSFRYISQNFEGISGASARGWDMQFGKMLRLSRALNMGFTIERGPALTWKNGHRDSGEVKVKLGLGYRKRFARRLDLLGAWDLIQKKDMPLQTSLGTELRFDPDIYNIPALFARAGINRLTLEDRYSYMSRLNDTLRWNMGLGAEFWYRDLIINTDYAFINDPIGSDHLFSVTLKYWR